MTRVLVLSTSRKTTGGIAGVLKLYEQSAMWEKYHCLWIGTHRYGNKLVKYWYAIKGLAQFVVLLPFYDIVHIHVSAPSSAKRKYPFFKLAKKFHKKVVIHLHLGTQIDSIWSTLYKIMFEQCDCGIVLSESLKTKVEEHIGKSDKIRVIYNPCPIVPNTKSYEKKNYILFSGHLIEDKGYKDLIRAFAMIAKKYPDWKVVFAGNREVEQARTLAKELGISNQIELLGWVAGEEKHKAYSEARALCLPSYAEGFPMTVLEAWAYGLPVITTPVGGIPDIAVDGGNMLLFTPGDVEALAERLERIIYDEELRERLSSESIRMSEGKFNLVNVTEEVGRIYESVK